MPTNDLSIIFDNNYYLANNPDVAAAVQRDELTGLEHFTHFGQFEGRNPSPFFDTRFYLNRYADVAAAVQRDALTGAEHFVEYGQFEGRIPRRLFSQMYVFGDSLSDDGNVFALTGGQVPPTPPYFNGHFSNGPVWVEQLAPLLGLTYNPNNNFAIGGATTGTQNTGNIPGVLTLPGLQQEVDTFLAANPTPDPKALYVFWVGANDYLGAGTTDVAAVAGNLNTAVRKLVDAGAKNVMLVNLPNLGKLPGSIASGAQVQQGLEQLSNAHNTLGLGQFQVTVIDGKTFNPIIVDVNSTFNEIVSNPGQFGLTNVTNNIVPGFGTDPTVPSNAAPPGIDANQYFFWDLIHPTTRGHAIVADTALKTVTAIPELVTTIL